jgi:hypothetical protein
MSISRFFLSTLFVLSVVFCMAPDARAVYVGTTLSYSGSLSGFSFTAVSAYDGYSTCLVYDYEYDYCALWEDGNPWGALWGRLYSPSGLYSANSNWSYSFAQVPYNVTSPASGTWSAQGEHYLGFDVTRQACYADGTCDPSYWVGTKSGLIGYTGDSATVPQRLTWISYNPSAFTAPGCVAVNFDAGIAKADFQWTLNDGPVNVQNGWANGATSCVGPTDTASFGTYKIIAAKNDGDPYASWVTIVGIILVISPPPPPQVSPSTLSLSTGDTNKTITTTVTPPYSFTPAFAWGLQTNPNSSCAASLSFSNNSGTGSVNTTVTAAPAGCSGIFNALAVVNGQTSSNSVQITVPPQILIQMLVGEAVGQTGPGDTSQLAIASSAKNRFGDSNFPGGTTATYQAVIIPNQYFGASNTTPNGPEPELSNAVSIFNGTTGDIVGGSKCYWSPTAAQWAIVQQALNTNAAAFPDNTGAPGCWAGQGRQIVYKTSVGTNTRGGDFAGAPAFLFLRQSSATPVVVQIP